MKNINNNKYIQLYEDKTKSVNGDNTDNIYIEGDNLDVLKSLREQFLNKIRVIYIDPPYNTGKDFVYEDNFKHSEWSSMIYPRLILSRELMSDDGVIFISIDENEVCNLQKICNEIFGTKNFITKFIYEKTQHFGRQKLNTYSNAEYILCYAKCLFDKNYKELLVEKITTNLLDAPLYNASNNLSVLTFPKESVQFNLKDGIYYKTTASDYVLLNQVKIKNGKNINSFSLKFKSRWSQEKVNAEIKKGTTFLVKSEKFAIRAVYNGTRSSKVAPKQIIFTNKNNNFCTYNRFGERVKTSETASNDLSKIMGGNYFSYPKPVSLISYLISLTFDYKKNKFAEDFTVLDFFSGSGTTGQAVMELNSKDNGKRKFILIQKPEAFDKKTNAFKAGYKNICELGEERLKIVGGIINRKHPNVDIGFKVYKTREVKDDI